MMSDHYEDHLQVAKNHLEDALEYLSHLDEAQAHVKAALMILEDLEGQ